MSQSSQSGVHSGSQYNPDNISLKRSRRVIPVDSSHRATLLFATTTKYLTLIYTSLQYLSYTNPSLFVCCLPHRSVNTYSSAQRLYSIEHHTSSGFTPGYYFDPSRIIKAYCRMVPQSHDLQHHPDCII